MRWHALLLLTLIALPSFSLADETAPLLYSRSNLMIVRKQATPPLPWSEKGEAQTDPGLIFEVEVRDAAPLYKQQGWFDLSGLSEKTGLLLAFSTPSTAPVPAPSQYTPIDVLMISHEGRIIQIAPNLVLASLEQPLYPPQPVLAFLLLKGGMCEKLSIRPGDEVNYKLFKKGPMVLTDPAAPAVAAPAPISPIIVSKPSVKKTPVGNKKIVKKSK